MAGCTSINFADRSLVGYWKVTAVNGRGTPRGDYNMQFVDRRVGARFGCNSFGGAYIVEDNALRIDGLTSTLMGCPEPAASIERDAAAVLNQEMRITEVAKGVIRLDDSAGSIELTR